MKKRKGDQSKLRRKNQWSRKENKEKREENV